MKKITLALIMALILCLAGCGGEDSGETTTTAATTTTSTTTSPSTDTPQKPEPDTITVEHEHKGLHIKLDSTFTVGLDENDKNTFTFANDKISGTAAFGPLTTLAGDATTSKEYAEGLKAQYGEATLGTSTNVAFYVIHEDDAGITVEALYIHGQNGWLVTATTTDASATNQTVKIVGLCGINADEVPVA